MINRQLLEPKSIVVVGGSKNLMKPGGKIIQNILADGYKGDLYVVNPKDKLIQGIPVFHSIDEIPEVDLAIIAIAARQCKEVIQVLAEQKNTRAFIILSAGFSEEGKDGHQPVGKAVGGGPGTTTSFRSTQHVDCAERCCTRA